MLQGNKLTALVPIITVVHYDIGSFYLGRREEFKLFSTKADLEIVGVFFWVFFS